MEEVPLMSSLPLNTITIITAIVLVIALVVYGVRKLRK